MAAEHTSGQASRGVLMRQPFERSLLNPLRNSESCKNRFVFVVKEM